MLSWPTKLLLPKNSPKEGDVRVKRRFLLFPKSINGQTRWLGMAYWEEEAKEYAIMDTSLYGPPGFYPEIFWEPTKWLRDKQAWLERKWEEHLNKQKEQQQK